MEHNLFKYIWRHSRVEQVGILFLVLASMPFYFLSLNLPKNIVNTGIQGQGYDFPGSTQPFLHIRLPYGELMFGHPVELFGGFQLEQQSMLMVLSVAFLALVIVNGLFKFQINSRKGRMGERMLRRLRYELTDRVLRFPIPALRRMRQAEVATMIKDEVEPLGGFIGDSFVTPAFLGGQALTAMAFILLQSIWLGLVAASIVLIQAFIIPRLRRRILLLGKARQLTARQLAGRVGELMAGSVEIHANATSNYERADLVGRLARIFDIRYEIFQRKFFVKFLNNLLAQLTPFFFYAVGGWLALHGRLDIGALVAVIAAYKDLPGPVKELIDWDQQRADVQIKYEQVIEQFEPVALIEPAVQALDAEETPPPEPDSGFALNAVSVEDDSGSRVLEGVNLKLPLGSNIAVVGTPGGGKEPFGKLLAGLVRPSGGDIKLGGRRLDAWTELALAQRRAYVGPDAFHFAGTVGDNLVYGLKARPRENQEAARSEARRLAAIEARRAGNPLLWSDDDWVDPELAGVGDRKALAAAALAALELVELDEDIYRLGLSQTIDPVKRPDLAKLFLEARAALVERLEAAGLTGLVAGFDPETYNPNAAVWENLLFGTAPGGEAAARALVNDPLVAEVLEETGLDRRLMAVGLEIANTMVELFADLPPGHPFFAQFSFIDADELPEYRSLVARVERVGVEAAAPEDREKLLALPMTYIEARHRLGLVDEALEAAVLEVRHRLGARLAEERPGLIAPYDPEAYNPAASLIDNILFGRLAYGRAGAEQTIGQEVRALIDEKGLRDEVIEVGLEFDVGVGGSRLSHAQRQKLAIARAVLKRPNCLILDHALSALDMLTACRLLRRLQAASMPEGLIAILQNPEQAEGFARVVVIDNGRIAADGSYAELSGPGGALAKAEAEAAAAGAEPEAGTPPREEEEAEV